MTDDTTAGAAGREAMSGASGDEAAGREATGEDGRIKLVRRSLPDRVDRIASELADSVRELRDQKCGTSEQRLMLAATSLNLRMLVDDVREQSAQLAAATARAETVEAELRARLGESEWGRPRTEWTWAVRHPDGTALPPEEPPRPRAEDEVRREFAKVVENMGYRKVLLCRTVEAWREAEESGQPT